MTNLAEKSPRSGWKEPMVWLIAGLPLAAVIAGIATLWIAASDPDSLVTEQHRKEGLSVQTIEAEAPRNAPETPLKAPLKAP